MNQHQQKVLNRLKQKTIYQNDCWLYTGYKTKKGYGQINIDYKVEYVHRVSANLFHGLDLNDKTLQALHKNICPNKHCWNPDHIYVGTDRDNKKDASELDKYHNRYPGSQKHRRKIR